MPNEAVLSNGAKFVETAGMSSDQVEYMCGMGAAVGAVLVTFPINKLMFRQSLWGIDAFDGMRQLYKEGFLALYRGCLPPVIIKSVSASVMFGTFRQYEHWLVNHPLMRPRYKANEMRTIFVASMMSGSTEAILTPFERVQCILQDGRLNNKYENTRDAFVKLRGYGIAEYYRGLSAVLLRNGPSTFLYFGFKDRLKDILLPSDSWLYSLMGSSHKIEVARNFASGALLGCTISTLSYPLNVIRIKMMIQDVGSRHMSIFRAAFDLYRERAGEARLMFVGIHANLARSFIYWGSITVFHEMLQKYFSR